MFVCLLTDVCRKAQPPPQPVPDPIEIVSAEEDGAEVNSHLCYLYSVKPVEVLWEMSDNPFTLLVLLCLTSFACV